MGKHRSSRLSPPLLFWLQGLYSCGCPSMHRFSERSSQAETNLEMMFSCTASTSCTAGPAHHQRSPCFPARKLLAGLEQALTSGVRGYISRPLHCLGAARGVRRARAESESLACHRSCLRGQQPKHSLIFKRFV